MHTINKARHKLEFLGRKLIRNIYELTLTRGENEKNRVDEKRDEGANSKRVSIVYILTNVLYCTVLARDYIKKKKKRNKNIKSINFGCTFIFSRGYRFIRIK